MEKMSKEMEFYIYLMEMYAEYKNIPTYEIVNKLDELNLTDFVYGMYEMYHIESINNAFDDIDRLIKEKEKELKETK